MHECVRLSKPVFLHSTMHPDNITYYKGLRGKDKHDKLLNQGGQGGGREKGEGVKNNNINNIKIESINKKITLKGAILLTAPRTTRTLSCANHTQYIEHLSHAPCHTPSGTAQLLV